MLLAVIFLLQLTFTVCQPSVYHIANVYSDPEGRLNSLAVLQMAERDLRSRKLINENITFVYHQTNFSVENEAGAMVGLNSILCQYDLDAIIGPYLGTSMAYLLPFATLNNDTVIGYVSTLDSLSDRVRFPTFARVSNTQTSMGRAVLAFLQKFNWTTIALVSSSACAVTMDAITNTITGNISIVYQYVFSSPFPSYNETLKVLSQLQTSARIVILCVTMNPWDSRSVMIQAMMQNMTDSSYVYILPYPSKTTNFQLLPWQVVAGSDNNSVSDDIAKKAFAYSFIIEPLGSDESSLSKANQQIDKFARKEPYISMGILNESNSLTVYRPNLYSAMYLYGLALNSCLTYGIPEFTRSGRLMLTCFKYQLFSGLTGMIATDENADKSSVYSAKGFGSDGNYTQVFEIHAGLHLCESTENTTKSVKIYVSFPSPDGVNRSSYSFKKTLCLPYILSVVPPDWGTINNLPPPAIPICGFDGSLCMDSTNYGMIAIGLVLAALLALAFVCYCSYRKRQLKRMELMNFSWNLARKHIQFLTEKTVKNSKTGSKRSIVDSFISEGLKSIEGSNEAELLKTGRYVSGRYQQNLVFIRAVMMVRQFEMKEEDLMIMRKIFESNHENLNRFIGVCLDSRRDMLIVWNHCAKGKLKNLLYDLDIDLDHAFKSSILRDILQGLDYLHSNSYLNFHGNLNSSNCVISSRWVVLLTDFGIDRIINPRLIDGCLRKTLKETEDEDQVAPFQTSTATLEGSKEKDIYDLAEILFEVIVREEMPLNIQDAIESLQASATAGPFLKEKSELGNFCTPIVQLFKECRSTVTFNRPSIMAVKTVIQSCSHSSKNLLDHMFGIMEKYANSLEGIVSDRTALLQEERRRADSLLYQMLPRTVADALKRGESVMPEMYDSATIYFSDIVGFTNICSDSSPIQVVDMLNSLYNQFDAIINVHDCYKVETIGDAYLVVSGVPKRNGDKHVTEVCDMALEIMEFVANKFVIPHMKERRMAIRIGIHTGSVAAGVIGLSMPRYCLFGDTVNVASRMESHGIPLKIHISWSTSALLQSSPEYQITPRGETFIKGKGICLTHWLDSKSGHQKRAEYQENHSNSTVQTTMFRDYHNRVKVTPAMG